MMTIRKTVHTLLGFPDPEAFPINPHRQRTIPSDAAGLRAIAGEIPKPRHVVASSAVGPTPKPTVLIDPGPLGAGGGLGLCTECLGFESLDERVGSSGGEIGVEKVEKSAGERPRRRVVAAAAEPVFPPPLASLAGKDGRRSSFLKAVRMDGRILLTEVTIERPEIMRASRRDGRLRLHLVERYDHEEEEAVRWEWARVSSEGVTCQQAVSGNHNHAPQWWNHRFVATA